MENPNFIFSSGPIELKSEGEDFFVEGYVATDDLDLVNDIVTKGCMLDMANQMRTRTIKLDIEHESMRGDSDLDMQLNKTIIPAAKVDDFSMDKKGLKIRAMLNRHIPRFNEIKNSIKDGFIDAFSIAYVPKETKGEVRNGQEVRLLDKVNLLNIAFTGTPINTHATIEKVFLKSLDFLNEQEKAKPKKPKPQPDPHKEPEDEDEEEKDCGKKPKKKNIHNHSKDDTIKLQEVKKMTEDKEEAKESEESKEEENTESKEEESESAETKDEESSEESKEEEEKESEEVKALKEKVDAQAKEIAEIKAAIAKPLKKSIQSTEDKSANFEEKALNPLDMIA